MPQISFSALPELLIAVGEWSSRPELAARLPDFVALAEDRLNTELILRVMQVDLDLTAAVGARNPVVFPTDFVEPYALFRTTGGAEQRLDPYVAGVHEISLTPSTPSCWAVNGNTIELNCPCAQAETFKFRYRKAFCLTVDEPSNWLLANHPSIYLWASLVELAAFMRDGDLARGYELRLTPLLDKLKTLESRPEALAPLRFDWPLSGGGGYDIRTG